MKRSVHKSAYMNASDLYRGLNDRTIAEMAAISRVWVTHAAFGKPINAETPASALAVVPHQQPHMVIAEILVVLNSDRLFDPGAVSKVDSAVHRQCPASARYKP